MCLGVKYEVLRNVRGWSEVPSCEIGSGGERGWVIRGKWGLLGVTHM